MSECPACLSDVCEWCGNDKDNLAAFDVHEKDPSGHGTVPSRCDCGRNMRVWLCPNCIEELDLSGGVSEDT